jgi:hypothetical protein
LLPGKAGRAGGVRVAKRTATELNGMTPKEVAQWMLDQEGDSDLLYQDYIAERIVARNSLTKQERKVRY